MGFYNINYSNIRFGSIGLYIRRPRIVVEAVRNDTSGLSVPRELFEKTREILNTICGQDAERISITVKESPPLHIGLGATTQLLLSIAKLASGLCDKHLSREALIEISGRGKYSGIGVHGFFRGGFIVDGGKRKEEPFPPLILRLPFPREWKIVLVIPSERRGLGDREEVPILESVLKEVDKEISESLLSTAFMKIIRGVVTRDFDLFVSGVSELQRKIGEVFASYQGGIFSSSDIFSAIDALEKAGFRGTGQSSWGPLAYGFVRKEELESKASFLKKWLEKTCPDDWVVVVTEVRNSGARIRLTS